MMSRRRSLQHGESFMHKLFDPCGNRNIALHPRSTTMEAFHVFADPHSSSTATTKSVTQPIRANQTAVNRATDGLNNLGIPQIARSIAVANLGADAIRQQLVTALGGEDFL